MKRVENLNAPSLNGWLIAAAAGILAFAVAKVIGQFDYTTSGFFGVVVAVASGLVLGMPWGAADRIPRPEAPADHDAAPAPVAAPAAPVAEAAAPSPVVTSAPVAAAPVAEAPKPAAAPAPAEKPAPKAKSSPVAVKLNPSPAADGKPAALKAARKGKADDLKVIEGIGPALEKLLNENGIFHIDQIAAWGDAETAWIDANLKGFKGRATRDRWVAQAKLIGEVGVDEFLRRAKTNDY